jgi:plasmid stabilization system protein ParE
MVDNQLALIQKNPFACPLIYRNVRRKLLPRFPYGLFYLVENELIFVVACFHVKRDPKQWKRRID